MNLNKLTILEAAKGLEHKEFSSVELTKFCLDNIKKVDPEIRAFITVAEQDALKTASLVDEKISRGDSVELLSGVPYAAKDNFCTKGIKTTAGSKILENYIPVYDSTIIEKLKKQEAVIIGKTNMDEFAMGSSTENSSFFVTKNIHDKTRVVGGSSGGSAVAVASGEILYALGSDTGGSIRQPASFCGVVGLKPTYGRTSRFGVISMASSLDTMGCLTKTVADSAAVLQTIAGEDKNDATTSKIVLDNYLEEIKKDIKGLRVGIIKEFLESDGFDDGVKKNIEGAIKKIEELTGQKVIEVSLPHSEYAIVCYYIIMPSEVSSNLARYDGVKYGVSEAGESLLEMYLKTRGQNLGDEVKRRIMLGTYSLSHGHYDAYYKKALQVRNLIRQDFQQAFEKVDILISPTTPSTAFKIGEKSDDPLKMYLSDIYTVPMNLAGVPAMSMPCGMADGLPVGLQIIGKWFDEKTILRVGHKLEQELAN